MRRYRIAVMVPMGLEFSERLFAGALEYVRQHPPATMVHIPFDADAPKSLRLPSPIGFDAALIWAVREACWVERLIEGGVPVVSASRDWPVDRVPCIAFDLKATVESAVEHLGSRRPAVLAHLAFEMTGTPLKEARAGFFRDAAQRRGFSAITAAVFSPHGRRSTATDTLRPLQPAERQRLAKTLQTLPRPAGIWCADDMLARRVCEIAESLRLQIPRDIAVVGLGGYRDAESARPRISTIPLPGEIIGYRAIAALMRWLATGVAPPPHTPVQPPPVIARESTMGVPGQGLIKRALEIIEARACEGVTVCEVAEALAVSAQTLNTRFNAQMGRSPGSEIRRAKVAAAMRHLADPRLSIARVANLCGYDQQSKFSNFFRRETGHSPRDHRRAQR